MAQVKRMLQVPSYPPLTANKSLKIPESVLKKRSFKMVKQYVREQIDEPLKKRQKVQTQIN